MFLGKIPSWLKGTLLRNGAGEVKIGDMTFNHPFDGSAMLHRYLVSHINISFYTYSESNPILIA